jgi:Ca2+-binding RTX toxin-like protein
LAADQADQVTNSTAFVSALNGGLGDDILTGGSAKDTLTGAAGADVMMGMNGNDLLEGRDLTSDRTINCDGGGTPGRADKADLDLLPKDPNSVVSGCETKTRN